MDAVSNVPKRNALAEHLKDVIGTLEQKVRSSSPLILRIAYIDSRATKLLLYMTFLRSKISRYRNQLFLKDQRQQCLLVEALRHA